MSRRHAGVSPDGGRAAYSVFQVWGGIRRKWGTGILLAVATADRSRGHVPTDRSWVHFTARWL
jgi:hypothetical protein